MAWNSSWRPRRLLWIPCSCVVRPEDEDAKSLDRRFASILAQSGCPAGNVANIAGNELPHAPRFSMTLGYDLASAICQRSLPVPLRTSASPRDSQSRCSNSARLRGLVMKATCGVGTRHSAGHMAVARTQGHRKSRRVRQLMPAIFATFASGAAGLSEYRRESTVKILHLRLLDGRRNCTYPEESPWPPARIPGHSQSRPAHACCVCDARIFPAASRLVDYRGDLISLKSSYIKAGVGRDSPSSSVLFSPIS